MPRSGRSLHRVNLRPWVRLGLRARHDGGRCATRARLPCLRSHVLFDVLQTPSHALAIVGAGPRGTSVLERICASVPELAPGVRLIVHVVDPSPARGRPGLAHRPARRPADEHGRLTGHRLHRQKRRLRGADTPGSQPVRVGVGPSGGTAGARRLSDPGLLRPLSGVGVPADSARRSGACDGRGPPGPCDPARGQPRGRIRHQGEGRVQGRGRTGAEDGFQNRGRRPRRGHRRRPAPPDAHPRRRYGPSPACPP